MWRRLIQPLLNERGQLNLGGLFNTASTTLANILNKGLPILSQPTATGLPLGIQQLAGLGALLGGTLGKDPTLQIPDYATFASPQGTAAQNYLQGIFSAPGAGTFGGSVDQVSQALAPYLGGAGQQFLTSSLQPGAYGNLLRQGAGDVQSILGNVFATGPGQEYLTNLLKPGAYNALLGGTVGGVESAFGKYLAPTDASRFLTGLLSKNDIGGVYNQYVPLIEQQNRDLFNSIQQRLIAGQPAGLSPAMSGSEIGAIREGFTREALPRQQALIADLGRESVARQMQSAQNLLGLEESIRNFVGGQTSQGVSNQLGIGEQLTSAEQAQRALGTDLLNRGMTNQLTSAEALMGNEQVLRNLIAQTAVNQQRLPIDAATNLAELASRGQGKAFDAALETNRLAAMARMGEKDALQQWGLSMLLGGRAGQPDPVQQFIQQLLGRPQQAEGLPSNFGMPTQLGTLSTMDVFRQMQAGTLSAQEGLALLAKGSLLPALGAGAAGFGAGTLASSLGRNQFQATAGGVAGGAAAGALIGSMTPLGPIGTAIGAVVGGLTGFFKERAQQQELKETFRRQDLDSQADQVQEIGSFITQRLGALGMDTSGFQSRISQLIAQSESPADEQGMLAAEGGKLLLAAIRQRDPSITSLSGVPGLREDFIDYLTRSTFTAQNSSFSGGAPTNLIPQWAGMAGLKRGGFLPRGGMAIVGEDGPELLMAGANTSVIPLLSGVN